MVYALLLCELEEDAKYLNENVLFKQGEHVVEAIFSYQAILGLRRGVQRPNMLIMSSEWDWGDDHWYNECVVPCMDKDFVTIRI